MNIVVAMKQIPDLEQVRIRNRQAILEDVPLTYGAIDKNALEAAVQLKDAAGGTVYALSVGNEELQDTIKEALACGADEAVMVLTEDDVELESAQVAQVIAGQVANLDDVGIILFGEGSGDNYSGQMASRVAQILSYPLIPYAKSIELNGNTVKAVCSYEKNDVVVSAEGPVVISVVSDINEPRIPAITQILKAGKKPKQIVDLEDVEDGMPSAAVETLSSLAPESDRKNIEVKDAAALIDALRAEKLV